MNKKNTLVQIDHELLNDYVKSLGVDIVRQMLSLYSQQVVIYLEDIEKSLQCDNADLWQEHCHKMKGAAGSVGLKSLHESLVIMEKTSADITEKAQQLVELKAHNKQALETFNLWLEKR